MLKTIDKRFFKYMFGFIHVNQIFMNQFYLIYGMNSMASITTRTFLFAGVIFSSIPITQQCHVRLLIHNISYYAA